MSWSKTWSFCTKIKIAFTYVSNNLRISHFQSCLWITQAPNGWTIQESRDLHSKIKCQIWNSIANIIIIIIILLMGGNLETWCHTKLCQFFKIKILHFQLQDIGALKIWKNAKPKLFSYPIDILGSKYLESFDKKGPSIQKDLVEVLIHSKDSFPNYNSHDFCVQNYTLSKFPNCNSHDFCVQKYSLSEWLDRCLPHSCIGLRRARTLLWNFFKKNLIDK